MKHFKVEQENENGVAFHLQRGFHDIFILKLSNGSVGFSWWTNDDSKRRTYLSFNVDEVKDIREILDKLIGVQIAS